ncbi:MAG: hypothetical protein ACHQET_12630 [Chitinophagales bacterium]
MSSCIKTSSLVNIPTAPPPTSTNTDTTHPAITNVGTPVGNSVSQTIGPSGGSITSSNGAVQLTIPAGALSANTIITIQPVTNECPGGLGLGYDFLPNGTQFAKPATLSFQYGQEDSLNDPNLFFIAYQDQDNSWNADLGGVNLDTATKRVSLDISHFTIYQIFAGMYINNSNPSSEYQRGDHSILNVMETFDPSYATTVGYNNNPIKLKIDIVPGSAIDHWGLLFVGPEFGTLNTESDNLFTEFYAPAHIDPAILHSFPAAYMRLIVQVPGKNGKLKSIKNPTLYRTLHFLPYYTYDVKIRLALIGASGYYGDIYLDSASFQIDINPKWIYENDGTPEVSGYEVTLSNELNSPPDDEPKHFENSSYKIDWLPDSYGLINITGATRALAEPLDKTVSILFNEPGTELPGWIIIDKTTGNDLGWPPAQAPGEPAGIIFSFWDSSQFQSHHENPLLPYTITITSQ